MIRRPPRSTLSSSSAASDVYKRQVMWGKVPVYSWLPFPIAVGELPFSALACVHSGWFAAVWLPGRTRLPFHSRPPCILSAHWHASQAALLWLLFLAVSP